VKESPAMCVAYRDDGFWPLLWFLFCYRLKRGRLKTFPPPGFVGLVSTSSRVGDAPQFRLSSFRMHRLQRTHVTSHVPLWRLTCEWETPRHHSHQSSYGPRLAYTGSVSAGAGGDGSHPPIQTTSISTPSLPDDSP